MVFEKTKSPYELDFGDYHNKKKSPFEKDFGLKRKSPYGVDLVLKKPITIKVWGGRFLFLDPHYLT